MIYTQDMQVQKAVFTAICRKNLGCTHFIIGKRSPALKIIILIKILELFFGEIGDIGINIIFLI